LALYSLLKFVLNASDDCGVNFASRRKSSLTEDFQGAASKD